MIELFEKIKIKEKKIKIITEIIIPELRKEIQDLDKNFSNVLTSIKKDILNFLIKESEIKRERNKAKNLSSDLAFINKNLEKIVEQRTIEVSLEKEKAEEANKVKDEFLAKISHEIRTPLTLIIGYSNSLKRESIDTEKKLDIIHNAGIKLLNFTNELLDFSKIMSEKSDMVFSAFDLKELLNQIYHENLNIARDKNLNFEIIPPTKDIYIETDKIKLYIILKNIIQNAIKYTEKGFVLCEVKIENDSKLIVEIYDSGIGISHDNLESIFESFKQINNQSTGVGLGLSITKKLMNRLGGQIKISSKLNIGTTFTLEIPIEVIQLKSTNFASRINKLLSSSNLEINLIILKSLLKLPLRVKKLEIALNLKKVEEIRKINHIIMGTYGNLSLDSIYTISRQISEELSQNEIQFKQINKHIEKLNDLILLLDYKKLFEQYLEISKKGFNVLIAEDIEENRDFFKMLLSFKSVKVDYVENGMECLKKLEHKEYDLIFLDIQMPILDGIETIKLIKDNKKYENMKIIALTAQATSSDREKFMQLGFDEYVSKPVNESILFSSIEENINFGGSIND